MGTVTSAEFSPLVCRNAADEAIHEALRQFVGHKKRYTVKKLQRKSGVSAKMIYSAIAPVGSQEFRPLNRENLLSIMAAIGADFANEVLPKLCGIGTFDIPEHPLPHPGEVVAESAEDHASIARAGADGMFCSRDHAQLRAVGQDHIELGLQLVALGDKPARKARAA